MILRSTVFAALASAAAFAQVSTDNAFQTRYVANLNFDEAFVNITNTGARGGVGLGGGTTAAVGGSICVNIYAFTPDELMMSCCSCAVTPNGLVSFGVNADILPLPAPFVFTTNPTSLHISLLATVPVGGSCNNSATAVDSATLAPGMAAWATSIHKGPEVIYGTETEFKPSTLSASMLARLATLCSFVTANSPNSICRGCRLGGR